MASKIIKALLGGLLVLALLLGYSIYSEYRYKRSLSPQNVLTVNDFVKRFGDPQSIYAVKHAGENYYEFRGLYPPAQNPFGPIPSGPPAYIFDEQGRFVTWCSDLGDAPDNFWKEWPLASTNKIEIKAIRQKFGL